MVGYDLFFKVYVWRLGSQHGGVEVVEPLRGGTYVISRWGEGGSTSLERIKLVLGELWVVPVRMSCYKRLTLTAKSLSDFLFCHVIPLVCTRAVVPSHMRISPEVNKWDYSVKLSANKIVSSLSTLHITQHQAFCYGNWKQTNTRQSWSYFGFTVKKTKGLLNIVPNVLQLWYSKFWGA